MTELQAAYGQKICTQITPIPLPADDCDRNHTMHAALSSLSAATSSFDAAMDSLLATTAHHRQRVYDLEDRITIFRKHLRRLDDIASSKMKNGELDDRVCMVYCPGLYEDALKGMEAELVKVKEELTPNQQQKKTTSMGMSSNNGARSAADAAVQKALLHDVQMDDGLARPSDAWLDHASMGLGVGKALEVTNEQRSMPLLMGEAVNKGELDYQNALETLVQNAGASENARDGLDRLEDLEGPPVSGGRGDDESVYSVTSQMSSISVASSTRMTAGQRRRWHKQQMKAKAKASSRQMQPMLASHPETSSQSTALAGRQQAIMGSQTYLSEVFHDSYGIGTEHSKGLVECSGYSARGTREGGTEFYPPSSHIPDLLVFNTTRNSYGLTKAANLAGAPTSGAKASSTKSREKTGDSEKPIISPTAAARKVLNLNSSATKSSLTHLVFKADANAEEKTAPKLNLPATLPQGLDG